MSQSAKTASMTRNPDGIGLVFTPHPDCTSRRLARFRRRLGAFMIITGAPVVALSRAESPFIRLALTVLTVLWLSMVLPMVRLLYLEWQNNRALQATRSGRWHPV